MSSNTNGKLDVETVYLVSSVTSNRRIHVERGCQRLKQSDRVLERAREAVDGDLPVCQWCGDDGDHPAATSEKDMSYLQSLKDASADS